MAETVDVVIPTYNGLPFLRQAVDSVLGQTHLALRLHVIDDGSSDATESYVRGLDDPRVEYVHKPNGGLSSARNRGIERSTNRYVAFLDADDYWQPTKLERQLALIDNRPEVGLVHAYQRTIDESGRLIGTLERAARGRVFDQLLDGNCVTGSGSIVLVRREAFDRVGGFREDLAAGEDWEMWLRIAVAYEFDCVPEHLAVIREWPASMQQDSVRMATSLLQLHSIVLGEFELDPAQRARVARFCLLGAATEYERAGSGPDARHAAVRYIRAVPSAASSAASWPLFLRLVLGRRSLDTTRRAAQLSGLAWLDRRAARLRTRAEERDPASPRARVALSLLGALALAPWRKGTLRLLRRHLSRR